MVSTWLDVPLTQERAEDAWLASLNNPCTLKNGTYKEPSQAAPPKEFPGLDDAGFVVVV